MGKDGGLHTMQGRCGKAAVGRTCGGAYLGYAAFAAEVVDMSAAVIDLPGMERRFRPPAPIPHAERMNPLQLIMAIRRNPVEAWGVWHFEEPYVQARTPLLGDTIVVNDPAMLRHVLVDNVQNYPKSGIARRVLAPAGAAMVC